MLGLGDSKDAFALALAAEKLPAGIYRLGEVPDFCGGANAALAWLMGGYVFDRYKKKIAAAVKLVLPARRQRRGDFAHRREICFWPAT